MKEVKISVLIIVGCLGFITHSLLSRGNHENMHFMISQLYVKNSNQINEINDLENSLISSLRIENEIINSSYDISIDSSLTCNSKPCLVFWISDNACHICLLKYLDYIQMYIDKPSENIKIICTRSIYRSLPEGNTKGLNFTFLEDGLEDYFKDTFFATITNHGNYVLVLKKSNFSVPKKYLKMINQKYFQKDIQKK